MPQGRMTDDEAYALARKERLAKEARVASGPKAKSAGATGGPSFAQNPYAGGTPNIMSGIADAAAKSRQMYANRDAGLPANAPSAPERKVNMRTGMGNTDAKKVFAEKPSVTQGMLTSNPLDYIKKTPGAMRDALGFGTDMLKRGLEKNTGMVKQDYIDRLKGSDVYRKLDSASQGHVMKAYQQWLNSQSAFNEGKRKTMAVEKDFNRTFGQASDGIS